MFLKESKTGHMVEVLDLAELFDLHRNEIVGRCQFGEEAQDPDTFSKAELAFLSGEALPLCWTDPHYRDGELKR